MFFLYRQRAVDRHSARVAAGFVVEEIQKAKSKGCRRQRRSRQKSEIE